MKYSVLFHDMILLWVSWLSTIFRYLFCSFLKMEYKIIWLWKLKWYSNVNTSKTIPIFAYFTSSLFSCLRLLKNSSFLFSRSPLLKCFKNQNFSIKQRLQTPSLGILWRVDTKFILCYVLFVNLSISIGI